MAKPPASNFILPPECVQAALKASTEVGRIASETGCKQIAGSYPVDIQTKILYDSPEIYRQILPPLMGKRMLSFECAGVRGSIYCFFFADEASRQHWTTFVKPLLWGEEERPTKAHPELILEANTTIAVVSFANAPEQLLNALKAKLPID